MRNPTTVKLFRVPIQKPMNQRQSFADSHPEPFEVWELQGKVAVCVKGNPSYININGVTPSNGEQFLLNLLNVINNKSYIYGIGSNS